MINRGNHSPNLESETEDRSVLTRRELLSGLAATAAISAVRLDAGPASPDSQAQPQAQDDQQPYDLIIQGGRVLDSAQNIDAQLDVAIRAGKIARVAANIPAARGRQVLIAKDKIVAPGLIDLHTHVFPYVCPYGVEPDPFCVKRGVTTVIDAGSAGAFGFPAFRRYIETAGANTRMFALLNLSAMGNVSGPIPNMGELSELRFVDLQLAVQVAEKNRDLIVGFKVRCSESVTGPNDIEVMKRVRSAADEAHLPVMMHIGASYSPLPDLLAFLKKGDVLTHPYNARAHGALQANGKLLPEVAEARQRGVLFDVGHGGGNFSFEVAAKCLDQGFVPDTISSDLTNINVHGPVYDLLTTLSKFLSLGMSVKDVIACVTANARRIFDTRLEIGALKPGAEADVSIVELRDGDFAFQDSDGKSRTGRQRLAPVATVRGGKILYPEYPV